MNKLLLAIPSLCDYIASTMQYIALNFIQGSIYQIIKGGIIITTAILFKIVLKINIESHQKLGCILAFIGIAIAGFSNIYFKEQSFNDKSIVSYLIILDFADMGLRTNIDNFGCVCIFSCVLAETFE